MKNPAFSAAAKPEPVSTETEFHFVQGHRSAHHRLDRTFAVLIFLQWTAGIIFTLLRRGDAAYSYQNSTFGLWQTAFLLGGIIVLPTVLLAVLRPGKIETRQAITVAQIMIASLLTYLIGRNPETHIHLFISLAILSLYRDWRVLVSAMVFGALEHFAYYLPSSKNFSELFAIGAAHWSAYSWWLFAANLFLIFWWMRNEENRERRNEFIARLNESEERYRKFVETAEDLIYKTDENGYFTFLNSAFRALLGYSDENKNLRYLDIIPPEYRKKAAKFYSRQRLRRTPGTYYELPIVAADGREIWIGQKVQLIFENGEIKGFQAVARDISEVKTAQNELAASEEKYRFLVNFLPQHIWKINLRGNLTYFNEQSFKYLGLDSPADGRQINWRDIVHPDDFWVSRQLWRNAVKRREVFEYEYRIRRADGEYRWFLGQIIPVLNEKNRITHFFGASLDIHERKAAQEEAARNREYLNLFKHANDSIVIYDPESEAILDVNDFACRTFGYRREEFLDLNLSDLCRDNEGRARRNRRLLEDKSIESFESVHYCKDGTPISLSINSSLIEFRGSQAVISIKRDITAALEANRALRENENKLQSLIENMSEAFIEVGKDGEILFVNRQFCEITGYSSEELSGQSIFKVIVNEEGSKQLQEAMGRRVQGCSDIYELKFYHKNGEPVWVLIGGVPTTDSAGEITGSMGILTNITGRKRNEELLRFNALHDALTGLPNRHLLLEHLQNSISRVARYSEEIFAVLFLDLNLFKIVNDSLGHLEGDKLLVMTARRLEECVRATDVIARFGGDEFTILLDRVAGMDDVLLVVNRIKDALKKPFVLSGREIFISTSIGIVLSDQKYAKPEEILRDADTAMYRAKANNTSPYEVFNPQMHEQANLRLQLEMEMRSAIEKSEFQAHYQPIVELETTRIVGFEALIRWAHPTRGLIAPLDFIPFAEENGLIVPIGEWILREACRQTRQWQTQNPANAELNISVNLSCKQFDQENLVETVAQILAETDFQPEFLRLEITESHLMQKSGNAVETMNRLRDLGVKISIDDFGTGYSNLSYLHQMPVNFLKIDRSFVNRMEENQENREIVRTILALAANLGFAVIAEGIETEAQAEHLRMLNCEFGQGYLFSKPVNAENVGKLLKDSMAINPTFNEVSLISETVS